LGRKPILRKIETIRPAPLARVELFYDRTKSVQQKTEVVYLPSGFGDGATGAATVGAGAGAAGALAGVPAIAGVPATGAGIFSATGGTTGDDVAGLMGAGAILLRLSAQYSLLATSTSLAALVSVRLMTPSSFAMASSTLPSAIMDCAAPKIAAI
jgi:hypothetical protein